MLLTIRPSVADITLIVVCSREFHDSRVSLLSGDCTDIHVPDKESDGARALLHHPWLASILQLSALTASLGDDVASTN